MNNKIKVMIKDVVEENAVGFKKNTSDALYEKINNRLKDEYKNVSKKMFKSLNESSPDGGAFMASGDATPSDVSAAMAPPSRGSGDPGSGSGGGGGMTRPNPDLERPDTTVEEWMTQEPNVYEYDRNGDGILDNDERGEYERAVREWFDRLMDLQREWYDYQRRFSEDPYPTFKPATWERWWKRIYNQNLDGKGKIIKPKPKPRRAPPVGTPGGPPGPPRP